MAYWVFNEGQLEAALKAHFKTLEQERGREHAAVVCTATQAFLESDAAREHKLIVDGKWEKR